MYVCVYVCMYVFIYVRIYVCMHACMYVCIYICMHICMYVCMYLCTYICVYVCMCVCIYVCMYVCMYSSTHNRVLSCSTQKMWVASSRSHASCLVLFLSKTVKPKVTALAYGLPCDIKRLKKKTQSFIFTANFSIEGRYVGKAERRDKGLARGFIPYRYNCHLKKLEDVCPQRYVTLRVAFRYMKLQLCTNNFILFSLLLLLTAY
jgi:hypothetical protein